jgi:hypothetical protein
MAVSHSVVLYEPTETSAEVVTVAGFLAGYSGRTREAYTLDLRQFIRWCDEHRLGLFDVTRTHIASRPRASLGDRALTRTKVSRLRSAQDESGRPGSVPACPTRRQPTERALRLAELPAVEHPPALFCIAGARVPRELLGLEPLTQLGGDRNSANSSSSSAMRTTVPPDPLVGRRHVNATRSSSCASTMRKHRPGSSPW